MQGLPYFVPTEVKVSYHRALLKVGFPVIDIGSFVSPTAIPQLADSGAVLHSLLPHKGTTRFLVIVGNERGALQSTAHPAVDILGYPWSISSTFLAKNLHTDLASSRNWILRLRDLCRETGKEAQVYISMAFGNPYGEDWSRQMLIDAVSELQEAGIRRISLSDTVAMSRPEDISGVFYALKAHAAHIGFHLHTRPDQGIDRVHAAWEAGCRSFDSVLNGLGGCPMTGHALVGNLNTLNLLAYCKEHDIPTGLDPEALREAASLAGSLLGRGYPLPLSRPQG